MKQVYDIIVEILVKVGALLVFAEAYKSDSILGWMLYSAAGLILFDIFYAYKYEKKYGKIHQNL